MSFVKTHGLWTDAQNAAFVQLLERLKESAVQVVRFSFPDQHGLLRGKTLVVADAIKAFESGVTLTSTLLAKDTSHRTVFPVFTAGGGFGMPEMQGACDTLMIADPQTFRILPWAPHTGWVLCDLYFPNGRPVPFGTRHLFRRALERLANRGFELVSGLEVEFHVFKLTNPNMKPEHSGQPGLPPDVELLSHGYQYLTELRYDAVDHVMEMLRNGIDGLELPVRSLEVEYGPSQFEFTFAPTKGIKSADDMILFRSAVKQICQRNGYHATFMCRPRIPNVVSSGWHLHQSLVHIDNGSNAFMPLSNASRSTTTSSMRWLRENARSCEVSFAPRREASSALSASRCSRSLPAARERIMSRLPMIAVRRLLKSCAMPPVSWPIASIF